MPTGEYLTTEEVAAQFRVQPYTILRWARLGCFIRPTRIRRRFLWHADTLRKWVEEKKAG